MLTNEDRRDKALRHFVATWGEAKGVALWKDYCRKSGLLEDAPKKPKAKAPKAEPEV